MRTLIETCEPFLDHATGCGEYVRGGGLLQGAFQEWRRMSEKRRKAGTPLENVPHAQEGHVRTSVVHDRVYQPNCGRCDLLGLAGNELVCLACEAHSLSASSESTPTSKGPGCTPPTMWMVPPVGPGKSRRAQCVMTEVAMGNGHCTSGAGKQPQQQLRRQGKGGRGPGKTAEAVKEAASSRGGAAGEGRCAEYRAMVAQGPSTSGPCTRDWKQFEDTQYPRIVSDTPQPPVYRPPRYLLEARKVKPKPLQPQFPTPPLCALYKMADGTIAYESMQAATSSATTAVAADELESGRPRSALV